VAEGLPRELFVLYAVVSIGEVAGFRGLGTFGLSAATFGQLLALQAFTALVIYLPIGWLAGRPGATKQPFITLTFVFFALFPLAFWWLGTHFGIIGLLLAYIIGGLREIGEPARKAMITELVPPEARTASIGLYWAVRTFAVMFMPIVGATIWVAVSPQAVFVTASVAGACGALLFAIRTQARSSATI
jgi:MFS family permease